MRASPDRQRIILPLLPLVLSLGLYLRTLAPTITWQHNGYDAGDLITAAYTLGIPHPTGYPTYTLLGKVFTLLPLGDVAYRMNLLSALCAALTILLLYQTSTILLRSQAYTTLAALCASLLLATSRIFWSQALITEVYALNCLFFAIILYLLFKAQLHLSGELGPVGQMYVFRISALLALTYGLSLGNHLTIIFSLPLLLLYGIDLFRRRTLSLWQWIRVLAMFLLGLSIYIYLPLRAGDQPLLNWGDPRTWRGFLWLVSGGIYRHYILALPATHWGERILAWIGLLRQQFGIAGAALGLLGAWRLAELSRQQCLVFLLTFAIYSIYAIGYNTTDSYVYLLPAYFLYALWIAQGAQYILQTLANIQSRHSKVLTVFASVALLILPLSSLHVNLPLVDLGSDFSAYEYGSQVFAQVPDSSIIISASDAHTFTLWYFARVVTERDQVAVIDRDLLSYDWYANGLRQAYPWLDLPPASIPLSVNNLIESNIHHAIFLTDMDSELMSRYTFQQQGTLYQLQAY